MIFRQDEAQRRRRTLCTSRSGNEVLAEKIAIVPFAEIFRPADDETVPLYFVYSKPARRRQGGKDGERKGERWAAALFILTSVIRDVGSVDGLQASRLPSAGGRWKQ